MNNDCKGNLVVVEKWRNYLEGKRNNVTLYYLYLNNLSLSIFKDLKNMIHSVYPIYYIHMLYV